MRAHHTRRTDGGSGLLAALIVIFAISGLLVPLVNGSLQRSFMARRLADRIRAQAIAEAGANRGYLILAEDFDLRTNEAAFPATEYDDGSYDVTVVPVGEDAAVIVSEGKFRDVDQSVMLDVRMHRPEAVQFQAAYGYAILADDEISWTGCGEFSEGGRIHANGTFKQAGSGELDADLSSSSVKVTLNGKSGRIDGDVAAPQVKGKTSKVTGSITVGPVDIVPIPDLDLQPYYNEALANGQVYSGNVVLSGSFSPPGGVMWVNGTLKLTGQGEFTGCFIATGDIHCSGDATQHKFGSYPGFVSRDGSIKFAGQGSFEGLVYARIGDIEVTGSGSVDGTIITGSSFKKAGCSTIFAFVESIPVAPNDNPTEGVLCVSAWQK